MFGLLNVTHLGPQGFGEIMIQTHNHTPEIHIFMYSGQNIADMKLETTDRY